MKILKVVEVVKRDIFVLFCVVNLLVQFLLFIFIFNLLKEKIKNMVYRIRGYGLFVECQRKVKFEIILDKVIEEMSLLIKLVLFNYR